MKIKFVLAICIVVFGINLVSSQEKNDLYKQLYNNNFFVKENIKDVNNINTNTSNINLVSLNQIGNYNNIDISKKSNASQKIVQIGDNNDYNFTSYYSQMPLDLNVLQKGNSNALHIYGENSIIKNISIVQKSNFKTLIIKNY
jgi:hypothetical protein